MEEKDEIALNYLTALAKASWQVIREKSVVGSLPLLAEPYQHVEISGFSYDEKGPAYTQSSHETWFKQDWRRAAFDIGKVIHPSEIYLATQAYLKANYPYPHTDTLMQQYSFQLFDILLQHLPQVINITAVEAHQRRFLRDLKQEPHPVVATVYLSGLTLESDELKLYEHIILRRPLVTDQEFINSQGIFPMIHFPTAVLELRYERHYNDYAVIHETMGLYIILLRLFEPSSIHRDYYQLEFDTVTAPHRMSSDHSGIKRGWHVFNFKQSDEKRLSFFLQNFKLPKNLTAIPKMPDYRSTAYDRYRESLSDSIPIEQRVANAIMGVEALLSDSQMELSFRLSCRSAKLLSLVGFDPLKVKRNLGMAYAIRSNYAHGGFIDQKERKKIETKFEPLDNFALNIVNYLLALFLISTQIQLSKKELLQLLDDSLVDQPASAQLEKRIASALPFFNKYF